MHNEVVRENLPISPHNLNSQKAPPVFVKKIGKTTYRAKIHFSKTSKETMNDKIKRMLHNEAQQVL